MAAAVTAAATGATKSSSSARTARAHPKGAKESACGCAGVFSAHAALPFYAMAFEKEGKLGNLEAFASHNGADFYGVPRNEGTVTLVREAWECPGSTSSAVTWWCPSWPVRRFPGAWWRRDER